MECIYFGGDGDPSACTNSKVPFKEKTPHRCPHSLSSYARKHRCKFASFEDDEAPENYSENVEIDQCLLGEFTEKGREKHESHNRD